MVYSSVVVCASLNFSVSGGEVV